MHRFHPLIYSIPTNTIEQGGLRLFEEARIGEKGGREQEDEKGKVQSKVYGPVRKRMDEAIGTAWQGELRGRRKGTEL